VVPAARRPGGGRRRILQRPRRPVQPPGIACASSASTSARPLSASMSRWGGGAFAKTRFAARLIVVRDGGFRCASRSFSAWLRRSSFAKPTAPLGASAGVLRVEPRRERQRDNRRPRAHVDRPFAPPPPWPPRLWSKTVPSSRWA
jgi:hypothetical protein